jgi:hypothetical protein
MKRIAILVLAISLLIATSAMAQRWAHPEDEVPILYAVGIMGDVVPSIDGDLSEWAGFPEWATLTFADDFIDNSFGTVKDLSTFDAWAKIAWHEGTQMIYFCAETWDDIHVQESAKGECLYWIQDDLEWYQNPSNSGGEYNWGREPEGTPRCAISQQVALLIGGVGDDFCICTAFKWIAEPPYTLWAGKVTEVANGVVTTYEIAERFYDYIDETEDISTPHVLFEGDVTALSLDLEDQDISGPDKGQMNAWYTTPLTGTCSQADNINDLELTPPEWDLTATTVQAQTWGFIKSTFAE